MNWYGLSKTVVALRKNILRVDMRVYTGELADFTNSNDLTSSLKSILTSAITKGLDVVGIVANSGPEIGLQARQVAQASGLDIYVIPGEEYLCSDKVRLVIYLLNSPMPPNLDAQRAITYAHQNKGIVMIIGLTKRQSQWLSKIQKTIVAPDAVELYSPSLGGYQDMHLDASYQCFIDSGAQNASQLSESNAFTVIARHDLEGMGLLPEGEGIDYEPKYLQHSDELNQGANEDQVADGDFDRQSI